MKPLLSLLMLALFVATRPAQAQDRGARSEDAGFGDDEVYVPAPKHRLYYTNATVARYNPIGLANTFQLGWRRRLFEKDSLLTRDTYTFVAGSAVLSPAFARVGPYAEGQLLSVFRVFGSFARIQYFGSFGQLISFDDPTARYSDQTLDSLDEAGAAQSAGGWVALGGATLRAAAGPVAVRSTAVFQRYTLDLPETQDEVFYDLVWDRLAPNGDWMWLQDTDLLTIQGKARVGVRHTMSANLNGAPGDGGITHHRLGPLVAVQLKDKKPGESFNQPTVFVLTQWWLQHPYRAGQEQPAGLPLIALGFAFNGDFATTALPQPPQ